MLPYLSRSIQHQLLKGSCNAVQLHTYEIKSTLTTHLLTWKRRVTSSGQQWLSFWFPVSPLLKSVFSCTCTQVTHACLHIPPPPNTISLDCTLNVKYSLIPFVVAPIFMGHVCRKYTQISDERQSETFKPYDVWNHPVTIKISTLTTLWSQLFFHVRKKKNTHKYSKAYFGARQPNLST
jgi:hypothetical protein